jgi:hypothetical protein
MSLPSPIIAVLAHFQPLFTAPTWSKVVLLLVGTLLAHGRRTVTAALRQVGQQSNAHSSRLPSGPQPCALVGLTSEPTTLASIGEYLWRRRDARHGD